MSFALFSQISYQDNFASHETIQPVQQQSHSHHQQLLQQFQQEQQLLQQLQQEQQQSQARQQQLLESLRQEQQQSQVQQQIIQQLNHGKQQGLHQLQTTHKKPEVQLHHHQRLLQERLISDERQAQAQQRLMQQMQQGQIQQQLLQQPQQEDDLLQQLEEHIQQEQLRQHFEQEQIEQQHQFNSDSLHLHPHDRLQDSQLLHHLHDGEIQRLHQHLEQRPHHLKQDNHHMLQDDLLTQRSDQLMMKEDHISDRLQQPMSPDNQSFLSSKLTSFRSGRSLSNTPLPVSSPNFQPPSLNIPDFMKEDFIPAPEPSIPSSMSPNSFLCKSEFVSFSPEEQTFATPDPYEMKTVVASPGPSSPSVPPTSFLRQALLASTQALAKMRNSMTTSVAQIKGDSKHSDLTFTTQPTASILADHFEGTKSKKFDRSTYFFAPEMQQDYSLG